MSTVLKEEAPPDIMENLKISFGALRSAAKAEPYPDFRARRDHLRALLRLVRDNQSAIVDAISEDFGHRSRFETLTADVYVVLANIRFILKHLRGWMKPETRPVGPGPSAGSGAACAAASRGGGHYEPVELPHTVGVGAHGLRACRRQSGDAQAK